MSARRAARGELVGGRNSAVLVHGILLRLASGHPKGRGAGSSRPRAVVFGGDPRLRGGSQKGRSPAPAKRVCLGAPSRATRDPTPDAGGSRKQLHPGHRASSRAGETDPGPAGSAPEHAARDGRRDSRRSMTIRAQRALPYWRPIRWSRRRCGGAGASLGGMMGSCRRAPSLVAAGIYILNLTGLAFWAALRALATTDLQRRRERAAKPDRPKGG
jgi:hypothetical protein